MKKVFTIIVSTTLFLAGLSLLLYPFVANQWNNYRQKQLISSYEDVIEEKEASGEIDYAAAKSEAESYNSALLPSILPDSFAVASASEEDQGYMSCLNLTGDGMMGYVEVPKINIKIPIFHGTDEEVLQMAAGHLEGSSLPVGGEDTHAVISAHRGLPSAALFTDLDRLGEGDFFLLHILDDTLCYQVDQTTVVEPTQTEALSVEPGQDLVTLLTCTPYGVNSHRLLVRGHRVPYEDVEMGETPLAYILTGSSIHTSYLLWVLIGLAVTGAFVLLLFWRHKCYLKKMQVQTAGGSQAGSLRQFQAEALNGSQADEPNSFQERGISGSQTDEPGGFQEGDLSGSQADEPNSFQERGVSGSQTDEPGGFQEGEQEDFRESGIDGSREEPAKMEENGQDTEEGS